MSAERWGNDPELQISHTVRAYIGRTLLSKMPATELQPLGPYFNVSSSLTNGLAYGTVVGSHMATMPYPCYPRGSQESSVPPRKKSNQLRDVKGERGQLRKSVC